MADKDRAKLAADGFAWFGNVSTSVCIIFVNKVLMSSTGYGFRYGEPIFSNPSQVTSCLDCAMMQCRRGLRALLVAADTVTTSAASDVHAPRQLHNWQHAHSFSAPFEHLLPPLLMSHAETHQRWQVHCLVPSNATGPLRS